MSNFHIGVDPGLSGAITVLNASGDIHTIIDMPVLEVKTNGKLKRKVSPELLAQELRPFATSGTKAHLEFVASRPGQGVSSVFSFGQSYGIVQGVLAALGIPCEIVTPVKWKRDFNLNSSKDGSRAKALQLSPANAHFFKRNKDDGRAESFLIATWGQKNGSSL